MVIVKIRTCAVYSSMNPATGYYFSENVVATQPAVQKGSFKRSFITQL